MKIRINLRDGNSFEVETIETFNLVLFVQAIRAAGYWVVDEIYVPVDNIASIFVVGEGGRFPAVKIEGTLQ